VYKRTPTDTPRAPSKKTSPIRTGATLLCLGLGLSLASCQSYEPKPLDTAAHLEAWRARDLDPSTLQASLEAAHSALPLTTGAFDSSDGLTLEEGRLAALAYNPSLRIARLEIERARASAAHLGLLEDPEFSLEAIRNPDGGPDSWNLLSALSLSIPLSGRIDAAQAQAAAELRAAHLKALTAEWDVWHEVGQEWFQWSAILARREQTARSLETIDQLVQRTTLLAAAGELLPTEARLFAIERASLQGQLSALSVSAGESELRLIALMGLPPSVERQLIPTLDEPTLEPPKDLASALSAQNPRLAHLTAGYEVAEETLRHEVSKQVPDLTLGPALESTDGNSQAGLIGGIPLPILNANERAIAEARVSRELARAALEIEHESLQGQAAAATARADAMSARRRTLKEDLTPLLEKQVADAARLLQLGEGDILVLLESVTRSHQTRLETIDARESEALARLLLAHILGPKPPQTPPTQMEDTP